MGVALGLALPGSSVCAQSLVNGGVVAGAIAVSGEEDPYTFTANAGEGFLLRIADLSGTSTFGPRITLYNPSSAFVTFGQGQNVGSIALDATASGTYTVVVDDGSTTGTGVGSYNLYFTRAPGANEGGALPNGGVQAGTIDLGDLDSYTFTASVGEGIRVRVADLSASSGFGPALYLYGPGGAFVTFSQGQSVASLGFAVATAGTYTVVVADGSTNAEGVGNYNLYFTRAPGANEAGALANGGVNPGTVELGDLDSYTFSAVTGEGLQLRIADTSGTSFTPGFYVYNPNGALVTFPSGGNVASATLQAAATGTYTVVVADASTTGALVGGYNLYFTRAPGANEGGRMYDGVTRFDAIDLGDLDSYTFTANAGETALITVTDTSGGALYPRVTLYGPTGASLILAEGQTTAAINRSITVSGVYTLVVADATTTNDATGSYSIVVTGVGGAPPSIPALPYETSDPQLR